MYSNPAAGPPPRETEVLVVGGGIQGAGIAQASAAAGFSTVLVEKSGWASQTSSKSSKLIHGGLRYLNQFQLGLVYESLRERDILCRIAPHLVRLNKFYIPVYRDTQIRPWQLCAGLSLYALLGRLGKSKRFSRVPPEHWNSLDGISTEGLQKVFQYFDGQTDDARLTRAVVASARQLGAITLGHCEFLSATRADDGYRVSLRTLKDKEQLKCKAVVNVTGPWVNQVANRISPPPGETALTLVQGSHLVISPQVSDRCFYLESPRDGRAVFLLPWKGNTLLGTTEVTYRGDPALVSCTASEQAYLLDTFRHYFPGRAGNVEVVDRMAGLRVLPGNGDDIHNRTRDVMINENFDGSLGYISVCGGKLTGYRATGATVAGILKNRLGARIRLADTAALMLPDPDAISES